jgi:hypothetical protein
MKDIAEFEKIFKVTFPVKEHYRYYIDTLAKSPFYAGLPSLVKEFEQYERDVEELGYESAKNYKLDYALPRVRDYILDTKAFSGLINSQFIFKNKLRTKDELRSHDDKMLLSIDFKSANYSALKTFDSFGELGDSWERLCRDLDIHPTLAKSKSFRQYVFGNTNPKRLQKVQHNGILKIVDALIADSGFIEDDFVFISHDEFIVKMESVNDVNMLMSQIGIIINREAINMPTHYKIFINHSIGHKGMCVQSIFEIKEGKYCLKYDTLFKVPGHKFFKYFKQRILNEPIDKRDLMFMSDGEVAVWAEDDDSIAETITPEGEMSMDEIMRDYPYLVQKLKEGVPNINDSQIRKMINIFFDTCSSCYNAEPGCLCWNEE